MKNIIINNGKATVVVTAAHNVTVSEKEIVITLNSVNTLTHPKTPTKRKKTTTKSKTTKRVGRPRKTTSMK